MGGSEISLHVNKKKWYFPEEILGCSSQGLGFYQLHHSNMEGGEVASFHAANGRGANLGNIVEHETIRRLLVMPL
jgi:hypothetical protein